MTNESIGRHLAFCMEPVGTYLTIILFGLSGYEMIITNSMLQASLIIFI